MSLTTKWILSAKRVRQWIAHSTTDRLIKKRYSKLTLRCFAEILVKIDHDEIEVDKTEG